MESLDNETDEYEEMLQSECLAEASATSNSKSQHTVLITHHHQQQQKLRYRRVGTGRYKLYRDLNLSPQNRVSYTSFHLHESDRDIALNVNFLRK